LDAFSQIVCGGVAIQVEGVADDFEFQQLAHGASDLLYARITKLKYFFAMIANQVVVLFVSKSLFVMRGILPELVAFYQARFYQ
jgi:hypothetical protein